MLCHGDHGPAAHGLAVEGFGIAMVQLRDNLRVEGALVPISRNTSLVISTIVQRETNTVDSNRKRKKEKRTGLQGKKLKATDIDA